MCFYSAISSQLTGAAIALAGFILVFTAIFLVLR
jgi:hypothetical protein